MAEGIPSDPLVRDSGLETGLDSTQISEDGLLVAGLDTADELGHGVIEDRPGIVDGVDVSGNAAIGRRRKSISLCQHISLHILGVVLQYIHRAGDELPSPFSRPAISSREAVPWTPSRANSLLKRAENSPPCAVE
jgi:hypothetical protein